MEKDIYKMKLHDSFLLDKNTMIMRVAGGWIYSFFHIPSQKFTTSCFVKFIREWDIETKESE